MRRIDFISEFGDFEDFLRGAGDAHIRAGKRADDAYTLKYFRKTLAAAIREGKATAANEPAGDDLDL